LRREDPFLTCDEEIHAVVYDHDRAEPVCSKCGLVLDEMRLDFVMESIANQRTRASCLKAHASPRCLSRRLSIERNLRDMFSKKSIQKVVQDKTLELCQTVSKKHLCRGNSVSLLSSVLVYTAHRMCRVPTTLAECANASVTERRKVARCYDRLCKELEMNVPRLESADYLPYLTKNKKINDATMTLAREILERVKDRRLIKGANPIGIAASALYIASGMTRNGFTQKELASAAGVSEVTVRTDCKIINSLL
jgi:transcription initiation factor TFIIB